MHFSNSNTPMTLHWPACNFFPKLLPKVVHVWSANLNLSEQELRYLSGLLSCDEIARAKRFKFDLHRRRFIANRGILRSLLGKYLQQSPKDFNFDYGPYGKPLLSNSLDLRFNSSDSQDLALYAFILEQDIGIDVEYCDTKTDFEGIAKRFFSPKEAAMLQTLPASQKRQGFFNCWTRKEAFIKAIGEGLSFPLSDFVVTLEPKRSARVLAVRDNAAIAKCWTLKALDPAPGFIAAFAVNGTIQGVNTYQFKLDSFE